jgi:hypothetical protein
MTTPPPAPVTYAHAVGVHRAVRGPRWEVWHTWLEDGTEGRFRAVSSFLTRAKAQSFADELRAFSTARNREAARLSHISRAINKTAAGASGLPD